MAFKVQVGPAQVAIHQGRTVLVCEPDGTIPHPSDKGLYFNDTRLISSWSLYADGVRWELLSGGATRHDTASIHLANPALLTASGPVPARALGLTLTRSIQGGLHEDIDIAHHGAHPVRFNLEIGVRCDFADLFEVKARKLVRRGSVATEWLADQQRLTTSYANGDFRRSVSVRPHGDVTMTYANGRLSFVIALEPGEQWHACLLYGLGDGDKVFAAPNTCADTPPAGAPRWQDGVLNIRTSNEEFYRTFHQGVEDMAALRLPAEGGDGSSFVPAAGLPWFTALFGRDSLIASLQNLITYPQAASATLEELGRWQATERDDHRDAEPGKILHELRFGELAHFKLIPHTPYYGTADATPLYLITLHESWRWTGDLALVRRLLPVAEGCLRWIDEYGDRDGDGFQEFQTRSSLGYENVAWKDAGDSVPYEDGTLVRGPKAICELQGYVYDAWQRMAELFDALGQPERSATLRAKAQRLFDQFNETFWNEEAGFYAYTLDGDKRPVETVASNVGHCLWSGIVPPARAGRVVQRLMAPDMWSGWGIRTLSATHPSYNPYSYHCGSVCPPDNGPGWLTCGFSVTRIVRFPCAIATVLIRTFAPITIVPLASSITTIAGLSGSTRKSSIRPNTSSGSSPASPTVTVRGSVARADTPVVRVITSAIRRAVVRSGLRSPSLIVALAPSWNAISFSTVAPLAIRALVGMFRVTEAPCPRAEMALLDSAPCATA